MKADPRKKIDCAGDFFRRLSRNIPAGSEDTFTAILGSTLQSVPALGRGVVTWALKQPGKGYEELLTGTDLEIVAQKHRGKLVGYGEAIPDMIAIGRRSGKVVFEVWFEHKLDSKEWIAQSKLEPSESITQLCKYIEAARLWREQSGVDHIFIAYCTKKQSEILSWSDACRRTTANVVLLNPTASSFRWRDFHGIVKRVLPKLSRLNSYHRWILAETIGYWESLPYMSEVKVADDFDVPRENREGKAREALERAFEETSAYLQALLPAKQRTGDTKGGGIYHRELGHPYLYQVRVERTSREEIADLPKGWPNEAFLCSYTFLEDAPVAAIEQELGRVKPLAGVHPAFSDKRRRDGKGRRLLQFAMPPGASVHNPKMLGIALRGQVETLTKQVLSAMENVSKSAKI